MVRSILALPVLLALLLPIQAETGGAVAPVETGPAIGVPAPESGEAAAPSVATLEVVTGSGARPSGPAPKTPQGAAESVRATPTAAASVASTRTPRLAPSDLRPGRGEHLPYFPTAPPHVG